MAATLIFLPSVRSSISRISAAARVESPVSMMIQPPGASMAKLLAIPQPRNAYTPGMTASATFLSVMPQSALARSAVGVVMTPFGPVTVSMVKDGLCQEVSAAEARALLAASSARAVGNVPSASTATAQLIFTVRRFMRFPFHSGSVVRCASSGCRRRPWPPRAAD